MSRVIGLSRAPSGADRRIAVINRGAESEYKPTFPVDIQALLEEEAYPSLKKFLLFWTMMDTIKVHGYTRAAMSAIGRSAVGAWWKLAKHDDWGASATEEQKNRLLRFYSTQERAWDNIKDYQSLAYKFIIGAEYLRYFGQVAYLIARNKAGQPIGLDHLPGLVVPNVDEFGYFKTPAFIQYPTKDPRIRTEFSNPGDIVYIINPDWQGSPLGGSDIEALTEYTLPLDIHLQTAAREYMKNSNRPELIYQLPADISDEAFDTFVALLNSKYGGSSNRGRNPVAVQGELKVDRLDDLPDALPYIESRDDTREETLAVIGTSGPVLGIGNISSANIRESRRQFHETTMEPLFKLLESGLYEQVHLREFNAEGWILLFNNPDFLTAVERATVHMRYIEKGVYSPNEAREDLGKEPREGGDEFVEIATEDSGEPQGSPPEGREDEPDSPSNTGEPTNDDQDPPRGDQHDDETERALKELEDYDNDPYGELVQTESSQMRSQEIEAFEHEIRSWRRFAISRIRRGMKLRPYHTKIIPKDISKLLQARLEEVQDVKEIKELFDEIFGVIEEI